ncbi:signal peptide peptidase SppA [Oxalobacter paraformigenes]|uniref:Signal peptide peptidase SppA, 36K type n=1 Tax=Oxalobacter paraformigenes TaxID=556268 RepID=C3X2M0_9BURK|nr:signal peptide peptidase SppA [Oxalobacter paraformigenes]EEO27456.1 signal peptide peptidase SppA, 36K type [Oxalobacter paraformigenes]
MSENNWERDVLEKLMFQTLKEQRARRRWGIFFKLVTLFLIIFLIVSVRNFSFSEGEGAPVQPHTAVIEIRGTIEATGNASASNIIKALDRAYKEPMATGVILKINSPGGSPVQAGMIYDEIRRLRNTYPDKPLYVVVEELCASGGYYIAAAADKIYVDKASIVGSIGVMINGFGVTGLMDKLGIERRLLTAGEYKGFLDPFSPQTPQQIQYAQSMLNQIHQQFIEVVREGRGNRLKENREIYSGLVFLGPEAIKLGLADDLGTVESVARDVIKSPETVDYTEQEKLSDRVLKKFGASVGYGAAKAGFDWNPLPLR